MYQAQTLMVDPIVTLKSVECRFCPYCIDYVGQIDSPKIIQFLDKSMIRDLKLTCNECDRPNIVIHVTKPLLAICFEHFLNCRAFEYPILHDTLQTCPDWFQIETTAIWVLQENLVYLPTQPRPWVSGPIQLIWRSATGRIEEYCTETIQ